MSRHNKVELEVIANIRTIYNCKNEKVVVTEEEKNALPTGREIAQAYRKAAQECLEAAAVKIAALAAQLARGETPWLSPDEHIDSLVVAKHFLATARGLSREPGNYYYGECIGILQYRRNYMSSNPFWSTYSIGAHGDKIWYIADPRRAYKHLPEKPSKKPKKVPVVTAQV